VWLGVATIIFILYRYSYKKNNPVDQNKGLYKAGAYAGICHVCVWGGGLTPWGAGFR